MFWKSNQVIRSNQFDHQSMIFPLQFNMVKWTVQRFDRYQTSWINGRTIESDKLFDFIWIDQLIFDQILIKLPFNWP